MKRDIREMLKIYYGLSPHDCPSNICKGDWCYWREIESYYSEEEIRDSEKWLNDNYIDWKDRITNWEF